MAEPLSCTVPPLSAAAPSPQWAAGDRTASEDGEVPARIVPLVERRAAAERVCGVQRAACRCRCRSNFQYRKFPRC